MRALIPVDGSDTSLRAFSSVRRLLALQPGFELHLLMVLDPKQAHESAENSVVATPAVSAGRVFVETPFARLVESHGEVLERIAAETRVDLERIALEQVPASTTVVHTRWDAHTAAAINTFAEEIDADLIVMSTHGRSGIGHALAGSVAESVIRTATRPVLIQGPNAV
jgi:nucleotide-binding universal stress UspA family protein